MKDLEGLWTDLLQLGKLAQFGQGMPPFLVQKVRGHFLFTNNNGAGFVWAHRQYLKGHVNEFPTMHYCNSQTHLVNYSL